MRINELKFDRAFFHDFWRLIKPYWISDEKRSAFALLGLTSIFSILSVYMSVSLNNLIKDIYDAIANFDKTSLLNDIVYFVILIVINTIAYGNAFYFKGILSVRWRKWMTQEYVTRWLQSQNDHLQPFVKQKIDNPDQRISEDLEQLPVTTLDVFVLLLKSILSLIVFSVLLWQLSGSFSISVNSWQIPLPGYLFWCALLYGLIGIWITKFIGKKLASYDYQQQLYNADFRFALIKLRETKGETYSISNSTSETQRLMTLFKHIFTNSMSVISLRQRLAFFYNAHTNINLLLGFFLSIPLYLQKQIQLGSMMQISGAFAIVVHAFTLLMENFPIFAAWRAVVLRVAEFDSAMFIQKQKQKSIPIGKAKVNNI